MNQRYTRRLQKELTDLQKSPPGGIEMDEVSDLKRWTINILGSPGTLYAGKKFKLQFVFPDMYPLEAPEVMFVGPQTPRHPHIYSNGHICLSILYDNWSPALSVSSVCLSILSMLSSNTKDEWPIDNDGYVARAIGRSPKDTRWMFHDDTV
eukprot:TRINITY_DN6131_c0_g2_i1.p1 TRINITY_DN6131_c0_g2~~TRINITY_DN6131_c0_g2_i1.p1  ORF type:complete len:151 (+),score=23.50 TRINITY_DN6131_c0_g2_i1:288-740(+)